MQHLYIGVDGGASKTMVRIENSAGNLIGETVTGPANIRISAPQAWQSIWQGVKTILAQQNIHPSQAKLDAVIGIAGCEVPAAYQDFQQHIHTINVIDIVSDAFTACYGAHAGGDGAIIIIGSGSVGYQVEAGKKVKIGGWGFPHDDEGGGAWLGFMAMRHAVHAMDGREAVSGLSAAVEKFFDHDCSKMITWANQANSTLFAQLAPLVIEQAQLQDEIATSIMKKAAVAINQIGEALYRQQTADHPLPCALMGGIAKHLQPYLADALIARLQPAKMAPAQGAILLAKREKN